MDNKMVCLIGGSPGVASWLDRALQNGLPFSVLIELGSGNRCYVPFEGLSVSQPETPTVGGVEAELLPVSGWKKMGYVIQPTDPRSWRLQALSSLYFISERMPGLSIRLHDEVGNTLRQIRGARNITIDADIASVFDTDALLREDGAAVPPAKSGTFVVRGEGLERVG